MQNFACFSLRWIIPLLCLAATGLAPPAVAQNKKELERKKDALHKEIEYTNQLLNQTSRNKNSSINQLVTLNRKISARTELIRTINHEIGGLDRVIENISLHVD